jgi:hypothetical protein
MTKQNRKKNPYYGNTQHGNPIYVYIHTKLGNFIKQTFKICAFLKLSSSSAVALKSCLAIASIFIATKVLKSLDEEI